MDYSQHYDKKTDRVYIVVKNVVSKEAQEMFQKMNPLAFEKNSFVFPNNNELRKEIKSLIQYFKYSEAVWIGKRNEKERIEKQTAIQKRRAEEESRRQVYLQERERDFENSERIKQNVYNHEPVIGYDEQCPIMMNHQKAGAIISELFDKYAFFFDTGTGKTLLALDIMNRKWEKERASFLVICPKTIINTAWIEDAFHFFPEMRLLPLSSNASYFNICNQWWHINHEMSYPGSLYSSGKEGAKIAYNRLLQNAQHFIINPERIRENPEQYLHFHQVDRYRGTEQETKITGLIVDESAILKNPDSMTYKAIEKMCNNSQVKYVYLLSGKPAPNTEKEYLSQIEIVGSYLFSREEKSSLRNWRYRNQPIDKAKKDAFYDAIRKASFTVSKKDCFDLPPVTNEIRSIELDTEARLCYRNLEENMIANIKKVRESGIIENESFFVNHVLSQIAKLRQVADGFLIDNDKEECHIHDKKLNELLSIVRELGDSQALIWCQYKYEIKYIETMLHKAGFTVVTAYSGTKDKDKSIESFKSGKAQFMIAHPRTLQYGVTLTNCCYAIYFSLSYSFEEYYQSHDRIYRKGQELPCTYLFIQASDTIDEIIYDAVMSKKTRAEFVESVLKLIEKR